MRIGNESWGGAGGTQHLGDSYELGPVCSPFQLEVFSPPYSSSGVTLDGWVGFRPDPVVTFPLQTPPQLPTINSFLGCCKTKSCAGQEEVIFLAQRQVFPGHELSCLVRRDIRLTTDYYIDQQHLSRVSERASLTALPGDAGTWGLLCVKQMLPHWGNVKLPLRKVMGLILELFWLQLFHIWVSDSLVTKTIDNLRLCGQSFSTHLGNFTRQVETLSTALEVPHMLLLQCTSLKLPPSMRLIF